MVVWGLVLVCGFVAYSSYWVDAARGYASGDLCLYVEFSKGLWRESVGGGTSGGQERDHFRGCGYLSAKRGVCTGLSMGAGSGDL